MAGISYAGWLIFQCKISPYFCFFYYVNSSIYSKNFFYFLALLPSSLICFTALLVFSITTLADILTPMFEKFLVLQILLLFIQFFTTYSYISLICLVLKFFSSFRKAFTIKSFNVFMFISFFVSSF